MASPEEVHWVWQLVNNETQGDVSYKSSVIFVGTFVNEASIDVLLPNAAAHISHSSVLKCVGRFTMTYGILFVLDLP
jgi:hypothetical protein